MTRPVQYIPGCWPSEMRAAIAAAYVDEPSVEAFLAKVERGIYGPPHREPGSLPKWLRAKLDSELARRHGLVVSLGAGDDARDLV